MCKKDQHEHEHGHGEVTHSHNGNEHRHEAAVHTHEHGHDEGHHLHSHVKVKGMTCEHCVETVTKALLSLPGVTEVQVELTSGLVSYQSARPASSEELTRVITATDYEVITA
jgi:copper chaperone